MNKNFIYNALKLVVCSWLTFTNAFITSITTLTSTRSNNAVSIIGQRTINIKKIHGSTRLMEWLKNKRFFTGSLQSSSTRINNSNDDDDDSNQDKSLYGRYTEERPELVDQSSFIESVEIIQRAVAAEKGIEYVKEIDPNLAFAIGRAFAKINIPPGIDLVETPHLVLVNGVNQAAKGAGIEPLDSIVGISVVNGDFKINTNGCNMDDTVSAMRAAMAHARENGYTEIELELNRLLKGYYK